ncbi:YjaG family protein [Thalassomonas viridans]|uniref:YjaG family protein n=1 Tax=Thalassomonas viridans TaxID=137584 RepID=A0AAE9Z3M7_9GAMM|nr:YjaG family protein [Thalassomonas viridans]WDE05465.1 YjaG family protein [Thalassomonas viridans]
MAIHLPLSRLSQWQQVTFCAALLERMLPNYQMFARAVEFGDAALLRNQLDLLWQWLDKNNRTKINFEAQLNKLEAATPNPELFDTYGVFPALDVCMALMSVFQGIQDKNSADFASVGRLSANSVYGYVELLLLEERAEERAEESTGDSAEPNDEALDIAPDVLEQHPLVQWEVATQNELFDFLKNAPENKKTCEQAKEMVMEEGLSNLGIEV